MKEGRKEDLVYEEGGEGGTKGTKERTDEGPDGR